VKKVEPLNSKRSDLLQAADVLMGAVGFHNQDFHLRPNADKDKVELARYIAARLGRPDLKHEIESHQGRLEDRSLALERPEAAI